MKKARAAQNGAVNNVENTSKLLRTADRIAVGVSAVGIILGVGTLAWIVFVGSIEGIVLIPGAFAAILAGFWSRVSHRLRRPPICGEWYAKHSAKLKIVLWAAVLYLISCAIRAMLGKWSYFEYRHLRIEGLAATVTAINVILTIIGLRGYEILPKWLKKRIKHEPYA